MSELEDMRTNMEKMEEERAAMVAEVEAQIERALHSMIMSDPEPDDPELEDVASPRTSHPTSRRSSVTSGPRALRSFGTETTLAEDAEAEAEAAASDKQTREQEELLDVEPKKLKRFSATQRDSPGDGMDAVDEGISEKSDRISRKVLEIQQKVRPALPRARPGRPV